MSLTVAEIITNFNSVVGDSSTDRISAAERLQYITEATVWAMQETGNDHLNTSYAFNFFDTVVEYKITTSVNDVLDIVDLRRGEDDQNTAFIRKDPRDLHVDIANGFSASEYALERRNLNWYLLVNHASKYPSYQISSFESLTGDGGEWEADEVNSDALNVTLDQNSFTEGFGSLNFDADVSQSGNNRATIQNTDADSRDLSEYTNLGSFVVDIDFPIVTYLSSVTFYWGSSTSDYYSVTVTTDLNGNAFVVGTNTLKFTWSSATTTGTPDDEDITYFRFDINYTASQADATDYRIDDLRLVRPEALTFLYTTWNVGADSSGTKLKAFAATTDVPYFSGQYDQYKYPVARKAAALAFRALRLHTDADRQDKEAEEALSRIATIVPSSVQKESKSFKVGGISFRRRKTGRRG